ncbi:Histidine--tRNA ligase [uncultured archaeon]|nr:Histidine--tRNA ligase [uncultured archaeon]
MINQPPRGMRDFYPAEASLRKEIVSTIETVYRSYGFDPIDTPALEYLEVLNRKSGEEVTKQIYQVDDMGMRFDFTVGLARFIANTSLPKPIKVFRSGCVWRRDEPQKGRYREFWQSDVDIIGSTSERCEAELLSCAMDALHALGIWKFRFRLNSRKTLSDILMKSGVSSDKVVPAIRALDKLEKRGEGGVREELIAAGIGEDSIKLLFKAIASKKKEFVDTDRLESIKEMAKEYGVKHVDIDYTLARGFDYYTGPVFEVATENSSLSVGGGGRYDELLGFYGSAAPAVGISLGVERLADLLKAERKIKEGEPSTAAHVYVAPVKDDAYMYAISVAKTFRSMGLGVSLNVTERDLRKQFDYANSLGFRHVAVVGKKEADLGKVTLRDMKSGKEEQLPIKEAVARILKGAEA